MSPRGALKRALPLRRVLLLVTLSAIAGVVGLRVASLQAMLRGTQADVLLITNRNAGASTTFAAYRSVLQEEGIPHHWLLSSNLALLRGRDLARRYPTIVLPDGLVPSLPDQAADSLRDYVNDGGNLAVVYDAGVIDPSGGYRASALLAGLTGIEYGRRVAHGRIGQVRFNSAAQARAWGIPTGKLTGGSTLGGYSYGALKYPTVSARVVDPATYVIATAGRTPLIAINRTGKGRTIFVNLPLGAIKGEGDDLPLRSFLRTLTQRLAPTPRLIPAPNGVGGLVISWHIDSKVETRGVPNLFRHHLVRPSLSEEFDITAGPDRDARGDGLGLDACGRGRALVRQLMPFGDIGSHGGWLHNGFADALERGTLRAPEAEKLIKRNGDCLTRVTGRPVRSYAAPGGVNPQPDTTKILKHLGIGSYYYTGDTGAPPNRTFSGGRMLSRTMWAFPVMPNGRYASIGEMARVGHLGPRAVGKWLNQTLDYVDREQAVRLLYSHPYDLLRPGYSEAYRRFLDRVDARVRAGRLTVRTMPAYARFMTRFVKTTFSANRDNGKVHLRLSNPSGLREITIALPRGYASLTDSLPADVRRRRDADGSQRLTVTSTATAIEFQLSMPREVR